MEQQEESEDFEVNNSIINSETFSCVKIIIHYNKIQKVKELDNIKNEFKKGDML